MIGLEAEVRLDERRRARLSDGTERFLDVQNQRCMTTWVLQKSG